MPRSNKPFVEQLVLGLVCTLYLRYKPIMIGALLAQLV